MSKLPKPRNDRYRQRRGGVTHFFAVLCSRCGRPAVPLYQKDGHGGLHRLYLNRIHGPERLAALQREPGIRQPGDLPNLTCATCNALLATPMKHSDGRLAFRLVPRATSRKRVIE